MCERPTDQLVAKLVRPRAGASHLPPIPSASCLCLRVCSCCASRRSSVPTRCMPARTTATSPSPRGAARRRHLLRFAYPCARGRATADSAPDCMRRGDCRFRTAVRCAVLVVDSFCHHPPRLSLLVRRAIEAHVKFGSRMQGGGKAPQAAAGAAAPNLRVQRPNHMHVARVSSGAGGDLNRTVVESLHVIRYTPVVSLRQRHPPQINLLSHSITSNHRTTAC